MLAYLDGAGGDVAVMGETRGEGRPIVEGELWLARRHLELLLERVDFSPVGEDLFFLSREVWLVRH